MRFYVLKHYFDPNEPPDEYHFKSPKPYDFLDRIKLKIAWRLNISLVGDDEIRIEQLYFNIEI